VGIRKGCLPLEETISSAVLRLPVGHHQSFDEMEYVAGAVRQYSYEALKKPSPV
jgi:hypothetical protein